MQLGSDGAMTFLHGDPHCGGNFYEAADGAMGWADWGVCLRGSWGYDYSYFVAGLAARRAAARVGARAARPLPRAARHRRRRGPRVRRRLAGLPPADDLPLRRLGGRLRPRPAAARLAAARVLPSDHRARRDTRSRTSTRVDAVLNHRDATRSLSAMTQRSRPYAGAFTLADEGVHPVGQRQPRLVGVLLLQLLRRQGGRRRRVPRRAGAQQRHRQLLVRDHERRGLALPAQRPGLPDHRRRPHRARPRHLLGERLQPPVLRRAGHRHVHRPLRRHRDRPADRELPPDEPDVADRHRGHATATSSRRWPSATTRAQVARPAR